MRRNQRERGKKANKLTIIVPLIIVLIIIGIAMMFFWIKSEKKIANTDTNVKQSQEILEKQEIQYSKTNGGKFVKIGNYIGFLSTLEDSTLHIVNLADQSILPVILPIKFDKLYFDGTFFYGMPHHYRGKGIYKVDLQGNVTKIYEGESVQIWLEEEQIYFVKQDGFDQINQIPIGDLCRMNLDGSNIETLIPNIKSYFKIHQNTIYYTNGDTRALFQAGINGENPKQLAQGRVSITAVTNDYLVYLDFADEQTYHVFYFNGGVNHEVGRFGNSYVDEQGGYIYTRKLIGQNNEVENDSAIFQIDSQNMQEKEIWKNDQFQTLYYIFQNKAYFEKQGIYCADLSTKDSGEEITGIGSAYFIDGKAYELKTDDRQITQILITNLQTNEKQEIKPNYKTQKQEAQQESTQEQKQAEQSIPITKTPEEIYGWVNESTQGKSEITKDEAIAIWKKERGNFAKHNQIIDYANYTVLLSATKENVKPNSLFQQTTNASSVNANYTRKVWNLKTSDSKDSLQTLNVYVDCYTKKIVGGFITGD